MSKSNKWIAKGAVGAALGALVLSACGSSGGASSNASAKNSTITVGTFGPESGPFGAIHTINDGTVAYFDALNAKGGIDGHKIKVVRGDDQYNPALTPGVARKLVSQGAQMMCGGVGSPENLAIKPYLAQLGIPDIAPASGSPSLFMPPTPTEFGVVPPYQREVANLIRFAVTKLHMKRIAFAYETDDVGVPGLAGAKAEMAALGQKLVATVSFSVTATSLTTQAAELKAANPDMVIVWAVAPPMALLVNDSTQIGFRPAWGGPFFSEDPSTLALTNGALEANSYWESWIVPSNSPVAAPAHSAASKYFPSDKVDVNFMQGWELGNACAKVIAKAAAAGNVSSKGLSRAASNLTINDGYISGLSWNSQSHLGNAKERVYKTVGQNFVAQTPLQQLPNVPVS